MESKVSIFMKTTWTLTDALSLTILSPHSHFAPGLVTVKVSTLQAPRLVAEPAAAVEGPTVTVVAVTGEFITNVSKSRRS